MFENYEFEPTTATARFRYSFDSGAAFSEELTFGAVEGRLYNADVMDRVLFLAFILIGISYYKTAPTRKVALRAGSLDAWQADFFSMVYQEGLSQFAFENSLTRNDLAHFESVGSSTMAVPYDGDGIVSLQSGGKDSLLVARMLEEAGREF